MPKKPTRQRERQRQRHSQKVVRKATPGTSELPIWRKRRWLIIIGSFFVIIALIAGPLSAAYVSGPGPTPTPFPTDTPAPTVEQPTPTLTPTPGEGTPRPTPTAAAPTATPTLGPPTPTPDGKIGQAVSNMGTAILGPGQPTPVYNSRPPTSGPRNAVWVDRAIYDKPIPEDKQVHNLEKGYVLLQYNCPQGCQDIVDQLKKLFIDLAPDVIVAPYPNMDHKIAATAWTRVLYLDQLDDSTLTTLKEFIVTWRNKSPEPGVRVTPTPVGTPPQ